MWLLCVITVTCLYVLYLLWIFCARSLVGDGVDRGGGLVDDGHLCNITCYTMYMYMCIHIYIYIYIDVI